MGPVETAIRSNLSRGMTLHTVPGRAAFEVEDLLVEHLYLRFGQKRTRTCFKWSLLESLVPYLRQRDWVEIGAILSTSGKPGTLDQYIKDHGPRRSTAGYIAAVLEAAGVVETRLEKPAAVRLKDNWTC